MRLNECFDKNIIRKINVDINLIRALVEISSLKEEEFKKIEINKKNISVYFPVVYDSFRETLEAVCISKGYKVTNHICMGELLKSILNDFDFNLFDRARYARNGINYYGLKVNYDEGKFLIERMWKARKEMIKKYLKKFL